MQVRVITLKDASPLTEDMAKLFPDADIGIQRGIDVRKSSSKVLLDQGFITHSVVESLQHGRRWHHELAGKGAIGLAHANRLALAEDLERPLLLLEEDCVVRRPRKLQQEIQRLLDHQDEFDMAVFGMMYKGERRTLQQASYLPRGFKVVKDKFHLLHCVLYTPRGRAKVSRLLLQPLDMQIDSLYGVEAKMDRLVVVGQITNWSARQHLHASSVQVNGGVLFFREKIIALIIILALLVYCRMKKK